MKTISEFIEENGLNMEFLPLKERPDNLTTWKSTTHHYFIVIRNRAGKELHTNYSTGSAIPLFSKKNINKHLENVMDSLALACSVDNSTFKDFCDEFGYDTDSRKAYETWQACVKLYEGMERLVGLKALNELIFDVERL